MAKTACGSSRKTVGLEYGAGRQARLAIVIVGLLFTAGCSSVPRDTGLVAGPLPVQGATPLTASGPVAEVLYAQHRDWAGTPYRLGGTGKGGIDCSAFVMQTFATRFGLELPRTTEYQSKLGAPVARSGLAPGDLLFFQTGYNKLHVGIYVEEGRFLHASTSRGVMISRLDNPYWRESFWHARRVPEQLPASLKMSRNSPQN